MIDEGERMLVSGTKKWKVFRCVVTTDVWRQVMEK